MHIGSIGGRRRVARARAVQRVEARDSKRSRKRSATSSSGRARRSASRSIEPGEVKTAIWDKADDVGRRVRARRSTNRAASVTSGSSTSRAGSSTKGAQKGVPAAKVADAVEHALTSDKPEGALPRGPDAKLVGPRDHEAARPGPRRARALQLGPLGEARPQPPLTRYARRGRRRAACSTPIDCARGTRAKCVSICRRTRADRRAGPARGRRRARPTAWRARRPASRVRGRPPGTRRSSIAVVASRWRRTLSASFSRGARRCVRVEHELEIERGPLVVPGALDHAAHPVDDCGPFAQLVRRLLVGEHVLHLALLALVPILEHREEEVVLALEVRVDRALREPGGRGDIVERRAVEAVARRTRSRPRRGGGAGSSPGDGRG